MNGANYFTFGCLRPRRKSCVYDLKAQRDNKSDFNLRKNTDRES